MKKNGFTLVELMTAIAVVGILAAIALPQFGNAIARARAAEVPLNLNKIKTAQEAHKAETKKYKGGCTWLPNNSEGIALGVKMDPSNFFTYKCDATNPTPTNPNVTPTFTSEAKLIKSIGSADIGTSVTMDQDDVVTVKPENSDSEKAMTLYLRSFVNQHQ